MNEMVIQKFTNKGPMVKTTFTICTTFKLEQNTDYIIDIINKFKQRNSSNIACDVCAFLEYCNIFIQKTAMSIRR